ncbi:amino acid efflux protein [Leptolyngbya sp. Heron Island J]|uniref:LysE family transporter n=1 Tax=Leptolyngbya sp. Heron Island J TaxID=1385935 RepID=UPI0003B9EA2D|nr:LysE family transporter [Leptolyngbya sp. Heron Island J]ESA35126.1 amino acid efflux protein [Leptolyngbya sp. Heron Island J]
MAFWAGWLTVFIVGSVAVITPGPDFALTLRSSLAYSRRAGVYTACGIGLGNAIHATYCLIGIGALISQSILLFNGLKFLGAGYLIYLGVKSLQAKPVKAESLQDNRRIVSAFSAFRQGLLGNLLNPKATLFFLALFTQIVQPETPLVAQVIYGGTVVLQSLVWFALLALLISQRWVKQLLVDVSHWIERVTGAVLILLGLRLAVTKLSD